MTKVLITVPGDLLQQIDRQAKSRRMTRSRFLEDAARHELQVGDPASVDAAIERARQAMAGVGEFDSAELVRFDRDHRDDRRG